MDSIHKVAIVGAGAMGGLYAAHFLAAPGFEVSFVARGARARRLREAGIVVNDAALACPVFDADDPGEVAPADLVLVAVKHGQLAAALDDVAPLVGERTLLLSVMNGLDSEPAIAARFGAGKVLYCIALAMDAVREDGRIRYRQSGRLQFGAARNDPPDERVLRVQEALDRAGLAWDTPVDMLHATWWKFMVNVGVNQASAVMRADYGACLGDPDTRWLMDRLIDEVVALSGPAGVPLGAEDVARWYRVLEGQPPGSKTSMLQDVEAGRDTELDIFAGRVVALGREHGVPTPVNETVLHIIRGLGRARADDDSSRATGSR